MSKVDILGVHVDVIDKAGLEDAIIKCVQRKRREVFAYINIHGVNIARRNAAVKEFYNRQATVYCDGEGVRLGARILGGHLPERTVLTRWIWDLCALFELMQFRVFLLGGKKETNREAIQSMKERFPKLPIAGAHHGYFAKEGKESDQVVDAINRTLPHVLFVALGTPEQELWISRNLDDLMVHAILPGGSMIEYMAGRKSVAPSWMVRGGLEWLYRLGEEPWRLWRRYLIGNPQFMANVLLQRMRMGKRE